MTVRSYFILAVLLKCVFSVPVSNSHMDNEDVKVIKCIVEVLADVLSKPHSIPVSQQCLDTLRTDDRLVTILRHRNFLQELQDIAVEGANERNEKRMVEGSVLSHNKALEDHADRSMLVAMERPGEAAERRGAEEEEEEEEERDTEGEEREERKEGSHEHNDITSQEKRNEGEEKPHNHILNQEQEGENEDKRAMKEEEEKRSSLDEQEADETAEEEGLKQHSEATKSVQMGNHEERELAEKRRASSGQRGDETAETAPKPWSHHSSLAYRRAEAYDQQEAPHHSKEVSPSQGEEAWKSPEEQELRMIVRRDPEDRREEEGSASKKTEDAEIESLAAIESELENVARKLHDLRRG